MHALSTIDILAFGWFLTAWIGYSLLIDRHQRGTVSVSGLMAGFRRQWMQEMAAREVRIVDTQINMQLQQGAGFYASTSLFAIGGALTLMISSEKAFALIATLPLDYRPERALWEVKAAGLVIMFIYAFFKFGWSYRLFNYCAILIGATPFCPQDAEPTIEMKQMAARAAEMNTLAGQQFNRGQCAFFFALGYLGWFASPLIFVLATTGVLIVLHRRQFWSEPLKVLK